ncbi:hypothetical protein COB21_02365 [Candidatus Aerophobetes bacterium]|uniref:Uncharacterized protein n=1 Tax=Aerophobetes bacterium TaxID=2030807 RepID=A0A2A4X732_UNCAE|nr:MAG: hypothetical protein COB21_02365 [Candidatus Aerophobetes bacterium]
MSSGVTNDNQINAAVVSSQTGSSDRAEHAQEGTVHRVADQVLAAPQAAAAADDIPMARVVVATGRRVTRLNHVSAERGATAPRCSEDFLEQLLGGSIERPDNHRTPGQKFKDFFRSAPVKVRVNAERMARQTLAHSVALSSLNDGDAKLSLMEKGYAYSIVDHPQFSFACRLVLVSIPGPEAKAARQLLKNVSDHSEIYDAFVMEASSDPSLHGITIM